MKSTFMISHFFIASCSRLTKLPFSTRSVPKVLVPLANGSEELEAVTIIDILVRGGVEVTVASVHESLEIACSRGVKLLASRHIKACCDFDWDLIVIPGGMPGASNLQKSSILKTILHKHNGENKLIGAICASPAIVLSEFGLLENKKATCYPSPKFIGTETIIFLFVITLSQKSYHSFLTIMLLLMEIL